MNLLTKLLACVLLGLTLSTSLAQPTYPLRLSFANKNQLVIQNTDPSFSYQATLWRKGRSVAQVVVVPNGSMLVNYPFKRKGRIRQFSVVASYTQQARDADLNRSRGLMNQRLYEANNIEASCLNEERQRQGWKLVAEGILLGNSRWLGALQNILQSQTLDERGLAREIESLQSELNSSSLSTGRALWLGGLVSYYKRLLEAKVSPYSACPELQNRKLALLQQAQSYRDEMTRYEQRFSSTSAPFKSQSVRSATNQHVFFSAFPGFCLEFTGAITSIASLTTVGGSKLQAAGLSINELAQVNPRLSAVLPLGKPFSGLFWRMPARLGLVGSVGQVSNYVKPNEGVFLGMADTKGAISTVIDQTGRVGVRAAYASLGFRYTFMPDDLMWLSWELGGTVYSQGQLSTQGSTLHQVSGNRLIAGGGTPDVSNRYGFTPGVSPYGKIMFSFALFPLANKQVYPNRKKVVLSFSYALQGSQSLATDFKLTQIQVGANNQLGEQSPLALKAWGAIGYGLHVYL